MSALSIQPSYPIFTETDGQPLEDGYIWIGTANLDPQGNPINVYWDSALTQLVGQPIRTSGGYPVNSGTPARLYVNSDYSIRVMNKNGGVVYSAPAAIERFGDLINASQVVYDPAGTGAVATNVQAKLRETVSVKDFGAVGDGVTDDTAAIQAAVNAVRAAGGGTVYAPAGIYLITSTIDLFQSSAVNIVLRGAARSSTTFRTTADIVVFSHAENCVFEDFAVEQAGTAKTGRAFSTPTNKQAAYCVYSRIAANDFKYGIWWRYSLWCSVRDAVFTDCGVGIKGSRNALPNDQTNPAAPGGWNLDPGFFHNQNTFDNVVCDGGEVGIWGTFNGASFDNVTCQNQTGTGSSNTVAPVGTPGVGLWLQNSGSGSSNFGANSNVVNAYYAEFTQQPMVFENCDVVIDGFYAQGSGAIGSPYEQVVSAVGANVTAFGASASDYFKYLLVASDSAIVTGNVSVGSQTIAAEYLSTGAKYFKHVSSAGTNVNISPVGATTTGVYTMTSRRSYLVTVAGIYDGFLAVGCSFTVLHFQSGFTTVLTQSGGSAIVTCTVSGDTLQINTLNPNAYNLFISVVDLSMLGNAGVF